MRKNLVIGIYYRNKEILKLLLLYKNVDTQYLV